VGVAQVGLILMLTVVGLPCAFFTLLALLDRFERSLSPSRVPEHAVSTAAAVSGPVSPSVSAPLPVETTADVVALPVHLERPAHEREINESSAAAV
jgi:hypothetical protein